MSITITPRAQDYNQWYLDVIAAADLADYGPVKGTMVIKPWGYRIWELMQADLDRRIKEKGVVNAYFPLFIPESYLKLEANHVEGFAPEVALVTQAGGKKLDEPLVVRPTSETVIYSMYAKWIQSYRDLPLKMNQWANIVRWEMRTRLFLRTSEFLWQEGHTAHATQQEAEDTTREMLDMYGEFARDMLALPAVSGRKSDSEKFAGAVYTLSFESLMQDGKALQSGTSHMLGQNFAKPFNVSFLNAEGKTDFAWQTSWGVSTRLIGGLIMAHSDDAGLVLPPSVAPQQVILIPIWKTDEEKDQVITAAQNLAQQLDGRVMVDDRDWLRFGEKMYEWEKKGVPVRIEIGPRDIAANTAVVVRRDTGEKETVALTELPGKVAALLTDIQTTLLKNADEFLKDHTTPVSTWDEFTETLESKGGFLEAGWCGEASCEKEIKDATKATIRNIPFDSQASGSCIKCGQPATELALFAKAY